MAPSGAGAVGRALLVLAGVLGVVGLLLVLSERFPGLRLGRLPGDFTVGRDGFRLYLPLGTSLVLSLVVSALLWLLGRRG